MDIQQPDAINNIDGHVSGTIEIVCQHCGQRFSEESFNIAIFLYGIFFLIGKSHGYYGITCPSCLRTICYKDSPQNILNLKSIVSGGLDISGIILDPQLKYFSPLLPEDIPEIGIFKIKALRQTISDKSPEFSLDAVSFYKDEEIPGEDEDFLQSLILDGVLPVGTTFSVWWFKNESIERLVNIENKHQITIFPRYCHRCSLIEKADRFCWQYGLNVQYLEQVKCMAISEFKTLEQIAIHQDLDIDKIIEFNPDIITPNNVELIYGDIIAQAKSNVRNQLTLSADFMDILISDPDPWDLPYPLRPKCKGFWKTVNPFAGKDLPDSFHSINHDLFEPMSKNEQRNEDTKTILLNSNKQYVQDFLLQNYMGFISSYTSQIKRKNFSYADFWVLKDRYFMALNEIIKTETRRINANQFYREDGFWLLSFQGKITRIKDVKGCSYLHFLLTNINQDYTYTELNRLLEGQVEQTEDEKYKADKTGKNELNITVGQKKFNENMISLKKVKRAGRIRPKIENAIREATELGNDKKVDRLNAGLSKIDDYFKQFISKKDGSAKTYKTVYAYKAHKDKIDKAIKDVLKYIKKSDEKAWKHLKYSIKNRSGRIGYESPDGSDWFTG
jgi:hypothetical protein